MFLMYFVICLFVSIIAVILGAKKRQSVITGIRIIQFLLYYPFIVYRAKKRVHKNMDGESWCNHPPLIWAHAGGGYPILYGNVKECFDQAIANGYRCLEVDVGVTTDGVPVLTHFFRPNNENLYAKLPSYDEFIKTPIADKYTPLTLADFFNLYGTFDGWFFLDGVTFGTGFNFREYFSNISESVKKKIIIQVFKFGDLFSLLEDNPFGGIHFSGVNGIGTVDFLRPLLIKVLKLSGVQSVSISDWEVSGKNIRNVVADFKKNAIVVSIAGVNTLTYYFRLRKIGVDCIDSDYLTPSDIRLCK